jgi:hypothetical protein
MVLNNCLIWSSSGQQIHANVTLITRT